MGVLKECNMYEQFTRMEKQRQDMDVVRFLLVLKHEYEPIHAQLLSSIELPSLPEKYILDYNVPHF